eukprot:jgi/Mesvir1/7055/Mv09171-RA.1
MQAFAAKANQLIASYTRMATEKPLLTSVVSSAVLWGTGDILAQRFAPGMKIMRDDDEDQSAQQKHPGYEASRTLRQSVLGGVVFAPLAHTWYQRLSATFPLSTLPHTAAKVLIDQTVWAFSVTYVLMCASSYLAGHGLKHGFEKAHKTVPEVLVTSWMIWPFVQAVNLSIVPPPMRLLVVNLVSVPWTAYLAYKINHPHVQPKTDASKANQ